MDDEIKDPFISDVVDDVEVDSPIGDDVIVDDDDETDDPMWDEE